MGEGLSYTKLAREYGCQFLWLLVSIYFGVKGMLLTIAISGQLGYYKERKIGGVEYQLYRTIARTPWSMKGVFGAVSDTVPLLGYHKRYWMVLSGVWALSGICILAFWRSVPGELAALSFLGTEAFIAISDLLCEGKYSQLMVQAGGDSSIVSWVWYNREIGMLFMALLIGPLTERASPYVVIMLGLPLVVQALVLVLSGWLPEERQESCAPKCAEVSKHKGTFGLAMLQSACAAGLIITMLLLRGVPHQKDIKLGYCVAVAIVMISLAYAVLPRTVANCTFYIFLCQLLFLGMDVLDYWFTAKPNCIPDGPAFDLTYYLGFKGIVEAAISVLAVALFDRYMRRWPVRRAFWVTTIVKIFAALSDLSLVMRWNTQVGIPDKFAFILGHSTILHLVELLDFLPAMLLISKLCPKGIEATMFAILAGFLNFGGQLAGVLGSVFLDALKVSIHKREHEDDPPCNAEGLPTAIFWGHIVLPAITIPLTFVLLPNLRLDEPFLESDDEGGEDQQDSDVQKRSGGKEDLRDEESEEDSEDNDPCAFCKPCVASQE